MLRIRRVAPALLAATVVLTMLAGCHPGTASSPGSSKSASSSSKPAPAKTANPTATPTATAAPAPVQANIASYLLQGTPYQADANGEWSGHYGFYTDASHAVACDIYIYSGDSGGVSCDIEAGHENQRTYPLPAGITATCANDPTGSFQTDGSAIDINYKIFGSDTSNANVGFAGCVSDQSGADPAVEAKRLVLPPGNILTVTQTGFETYTCSVTSGAATCSDSNPGSSFVFGLSTATFHQG